MIIVFAGNGIWHSAVVLQYGSKDCPKRHSFHYPLEPPHNEMDDTSIFAVTAPPIKA